MKQSEKVALLDLDGSLADYDTAMRRELKLIMSPDEALPQDPWAADGHWEARMSLIKRQPGFWRDLEPIRLGLDIFDLVGTLGYERMILTKGPKRTVSAWTEKMEWCAKHVPEAMVTITEDKGLVYGKMLYDDWPKYILRWLEWRPRGKVIMRDTPHNQGFTHDNVMRVYDFGKVPEGDSYMNQFNRIEVVLR